MDRRLHHLKETWKIMEAEEDTFCYMLYLDENEEKPFIEMQKELKGDLTKKGKFHATVRYVKSPKSPQKLLDHLEGLELPTLKAKTKGFAVYGDDKNTLVVELESEELQDWFDKINEFLLENDYPDSDYADYKPHISLTEKDSIVEPEWLDEYEREVTFRIHVVTDTNREEIFREKS